MPAVRMGARATGSSPGCGGLAISRRMYQVPVPNRLYNQRIIWDYLETL